MYSDQEVSASCRPVTLKHNELVLPWFPPGSMICKLRLCCEPCGVLMQRKASIEAKNEAETQIYSAESSLREFKDKLPQNVVDNINTEISNVRSSLESEDAEEIRSKVSTAKSGFVFALCNASCCV
jgi:hypothetical protein